ncbi:MAG: hypothetical protein MUP66_01505 [Candidatus Nanohaloarchaeota archaeon QJJ-5]|nr:hypothetical protein [Candidatus Nanohaloarchaeota archaeon QJJ-5]
MFGAEPVEDMDVYRATEAARTVEEQYFDSSDYDLADDVEEFADRRVWREDNKENNRLSFKDLTGDEWYDVKIDGQRVMTVMGADLFDEMYEGETIVADDEDNRVYGVLGDPEDGTYFAIDADEGEEGFIGSYQDDVVMLPSTETDPVGTDTDTPTLMTPTELYLDVDGYHVFEEVNPRMRVIPTGPNAVTVENDDHTWTFDEVA